MSTNNVRDNLAAHMAIVDLLNRYTDAINQRNWSEVENCFHRQGVWDVGGPEAGPMAMRFEGASQVREGIAAALAGATLCVQTNHAAVIHVEGSRATARSTIHERVIQSEGTGLTLLGTYHDDVTLDTDGEWRFKERRFRITYVDTSPLPGQVMTRFDPH